MPEIRCDLGSLRPPERMPDGRVRVDAHITRAGIFRYELPNGKVRLELRTPEEVFNEDSINTAKQMPFTNNHPSVGLLTPKTTKKFAVGATGENVIRDDDHLRTSVVAFDEATISDMENGKLQVSCGYMCDLDMTPGVDPKYGRYDAKQLNIRYNHLALVDNARAGQSARVRMDGAAIMLPAEADEVRHGGTMGAKPDDKETVRSLSEQLKTAEERADAADSEAKKEKLRADTEHGKVLQLEAEIQELKTRLDASDKATESEAVLREKARADAAEEKVRSFDSTLETRIRARSKLEREAFTVMGDGFRMDDMDDRGIMAAVVKRLDSSADVGNNVEVGVITGRYLTLLSGFNKNARSQARVAEILSSNQEQARTDSAEVAKQKVRDQWKAPLPNDPRAQRAKGG